MTDFLATSGIANQMGTTTGAGPGAVGFGLDESPRATYTLRVNGVDRPVADAWIGESLLYVLRERLGLAGAKGGCEQGECGACSVQVDGQLTAACLVPAALAADSEIRTVEGLAADGTASDVQRALAENGAVQCGYCVPGLAMAVHDLLERNHMPTDLEAREALCGNLCRCTGYRGALAAVQAVAEARAEDAESEDADTADTGAAAAGAVAANGPTMNGTAAEEPPSVVELPQQQQAEPPQQFQPQPPQYAYQNGGPPGGYPAADSGMYVLPHQQTAAPEAGA